LLLMRMLIWIVGLLALATSLDSSLYGGAYTRAFVAMIQDMHKTGESGGRGGRKAQGG
jgi:hypothetical protein